MASPPFLMTDKPQPSLQMMRTNSTGGHGNTINKVTLPAAEITVTYRAQFRFHMFYRVPVETPWWSGSIGKEILQSEVDKGTTLYLPPDDRVVVTDAEHYATVKIGRQSIRLALGESKARGRPVWFPVSSKLPAELNSPSTGWKWKPPTLDNFGAANQWGIRGDLTFVADPWGEPGKPKTFKMVTVWQRWRPDPKTGKNRFTPDMCTLPPGTFAGYPQAMPKHWDSFPEFSKDGKKTNKDYRKEFPAIWVGYSWEPDDVPPPTTGGKSKPPEGPWKEGVLGWILKNPKSKGRAHGVYIHPGNSPNWFEGCLAPGPADKQTEWGFMAREDTARAMYEILADVGISQSDYVNNYQPPSQKLRKWFIIRVEASPKSAVTDDGWMTSRIWLD
ncbi:MAG: hypothetical protein KF841_06120 [Phycisphaerae bacterium]|nr:hypothetical protein [Phycisphaerae bacterium]